MTNFLGNINPNELGIVFSASLLSTLMNVIVTYYIGEKKYMMELFIEAIRVQYGDEFKKALDNNNTKGFLDKFGASASGEVQSFLGDFPWSLFASLSAIAINLLVIFPSIYRANPLIKLPDKIPYLAIALLISFTGAFLGIFRDTALPNPTKPAKKFNKRVKERIIPTLIGTGIMTIFYQYMPISLSVSLICFYVLKHILGFIEILLAYFILKDRKIKYEDKFPPSIPFSPETIRIAKENLIKEPPKKMSFSERMKVINDATDEYLGIKKDESEKNE